MSLFNRPAWAKAQDTNLDEPDTDIFRHSDRIHSTIVAEGERKKQEKAERKKVKEERRSSGKREIKDEEGGGTSKRRRITFEDGEALLSSVGLKPEPYSERSLKLDDLEDDSEHGPVRRSPRINRHVNKDISPVAKKHSSRAQVIDLGDSDNDDEPIIYEAPPVQPPKADDESDDEFAELARRARQKRLQKEEHAKKSATPDVPAYSHSPGVGAVDTGQGGLPTPPPDPTIQLFISSRIPGTAPLIVHRKLSQRIQEIRHVWCTKQGFSKEKLDEIFFVHRMRRVYDVTTCKSLGLEADALGNVTMKGAEGKEGVEKVHLEAVTDDIFQQMKADQANERRKRSGNVTGEEDAQAGAEGDAATATQQQKDESLIRLTLKAKGRDDFKLKVKPVSAQC